MLQDCPAGISCGGSSGVLLTTTPSRPKRSPSESGSQVTWFAGQGLKGHSVAQRTAKIAMTQRIPMRFLSGSADDLSFTKNLRD